ncbi:MAG: DUF4845 domain-containing protein [Candidatus Sedimenticola sp. PURPLELP]
MKSLNKQKGMTGLGWLTVLALIGFFALLIIKIGPIYLEHYTIANVVESLKEEPLITKKTSSQIKKMIHKRLKVNGVYKMDKNAITVKKSPGIVLVDITYTVKENMFGNIDVLVSFSDKAELVSN